MNNREGSPKKKPVLYPCKVLIALRVVLGDWRYDSLMLHFMRKELWCRFVQTLLERDRTAKVQIIVAMDQMF